VTGNRRSHSRYETTLDAHVFVGNARHVVTILNLSLGGARIAAPLRLSLGTRVEVEFRVPGQEQPIRVGGSVRWASQDAAGVSFDGLRAREVWALNKYFDSL
jgi:hypothetical protein